MSHLYFKAETLETFCHDAFVKFGFSKEESRIAMDLLRSILPPYSATAKKSKVIFPRHHLSCCAFVLKTGTSQKNAIVILISIFTGMISSFISVFAICTLVGSSHEFFVSMLPKSITTAIGMGVYEELGGIVTITIAVIIITGIVGSVLCDVVFRFFHISNPVAQGISLGTSAHAIGTSKALSMGEVQGAMSSLSMAVARVLTVIFAPLAQNRII